MNSTNTKKKRQAQITAIRAALVYNDESVPILVQDAFKQCTQVWTMNAYIDHSQALQGIDSIRPQVAIIETAERCAASIEFIRQLKVLSPDLVIIILTGQHNGNAVLDFMIAGASGFLIIPIAPQEIATAITIAYGGSPALCQTAAKLFMRTLQGVGQNSNRLLSPRETEIAICACLHQSDKEIAQSFQISVGTVRAHFSNIFRKLNVQNRDKLHEKIFGRGNRSSMGAGDMDHKRNPPGDIACQRVVTLPLGMVSSARLIRSQFTQNPEEGGQAKPE